MRVSFGQPELPITIPRDKLVVAAPVPGTGSATGTYTATTGFRRHRPWYVNWSRAIVDHNAVVFFTTLLTMWALVGDDVRTLATSKPADPVFDGIIIFMLAVFIIEVAVSCVGKPDYLFGFYFWLDLVSTGTLVLDLTWVSALFSQQNAKDARNGRTARIGARAARVVRIIRLIRIVKLYKAFYEARRNKEATRAQLAPGGEDDWADDEEANDEEEQSKESRVGKMLGEITTRRLVILILALLLFLKIFNQDEVDQMLASRQYGADVVYKLFRAHADAGYTDASTRAAYQQGMLQYMYYHNWYAAHAPDKYCPSGTSCYSTQSALFWAGIGGSNLDPRSLAAAQLDLTSLTKFQTYAATVQTDLWSFGDMPKTVQAAISSNWTLNCDVGFVAVGLSLLASTNDVNKDIIPCPWTLRNNEIVLVTPQIATQSALDAESFVFAYDVRPFAQQESGFSILLTVVVVVLLIGASMVFSADSNRLVLQPVEKMMQRVEAIKDNPLVAMKMADDEFRMEQVLKAKHSKRGLFERLYKDFILCEKCSKGVSDSLETVVLEKTIIKLGSLLALGFGEAGVNIIGSNLGGTGSSGINAMVPGRPVECILGVIRVANFAVATEVLQTKIMTFGNQIAEIVHGVAHEFQGASNRNNGDWFLVIWQLSREMQNEGSELRVAESSIVACSVILGALHRSPLLAVYRGHPRLQMKLRENCRVNLTFGLHRGWAIEGAVGSEFKIDASYLSPNVSVTQSLERATEHYGVSIIVAQSVLKSCSRQMKEKCRLIDNVIITGSVKPMELYCVDMDYRRVELPEEDPLNVVWNTRTRYKVRQFMEGEKHVSAREDFSHVTVFENDPAIIAMRKPYTVEFFQIFNMGYQNYSQGEWLVAERMLAQASGLLELGQQKDGPCTALLRFMETFGYEAPADWQGVRELGQHEASHRISSGGHSPTHKKTSFSSSFAAPKGV